ncbi:MAG: ABC transporter permease [Actinomycetota bacterium]
MDFSSPPRGSVWPLRLAVIGVASFFAAPFAYLAVRSFGEGPGLLETVTSADSLASLGRSVLLGTSVALSATVLGTAAAWLVARTDLPGRRWWLVVLPLPLVIPSYIGAFVLLAAFARGGLVYEMLQVFGPEVNAFRGFTGSFIVLTLFTYPYVYLPAHARLRQLPPSLEESARLLGTGPWRSFFSIVLPQARSAIMAGSLLVFLYTISEFGVVQLMRYDTLPRVIYSTRLLDALTSVRLSLMLGLLAVLVVMSERVVSRALQVTSAARSPRPLQIRLGRWKPLAGVFMSALIGFALIAPIGVLLWWTVRDPGRASTIGTDLSDLVQPALNTSIASVGAALLAVLLVAPVAYLTVHRPGRFAGLANAVVVGGFALPGLAIALSLVYLTVGAPGPLGRIYQTLPLLVFAYVIHFGAQAMRAGQIAVASVPAGVDDAARTLGVGRWGRLLRIELPLMLPGLLAGAGLVLLSSMKELPATLLLAPTGFQTLSVKIWNGTESALFADASLASLLLIATSGILTWALVIRRSVKLV